MIDVDKFVEKSIDENEQRLGRSLTPQEDSVMLDGAADNAKADDQMREEVKLKKGVQLWENGLYWAEMNIGSESPEDCGWYFWWGDTVGYKRVNDVWVAGDGTLSNFSFDDVPTSQKSLAVLQKEGWLTTDGVLAPRYDAAHVQWGGEWRMPTGREFFTLLDKCNWTWTEMNGVCGYIVRGRGDYASASIFLPCAGFGYASSLGLADSSGHYLTSVPYTDHSSTDYDCLAFGLQFVSGYHGMDFTDRNNGLSVRPVQGVRQKAAAFTEKRKVQ